MNATDQRCPECRGEGYQEVRRRGKALRDLEPCDLCLGEGWVSARDIEHERHERNGRGSRL